MLGCLLLNCCMGSLYAWPIFLTAYETLMQLQRSQLSLVFSTAMGVFACVMLAGSGLHAWLPTPRVAVLSMLSAACGLLLVGYSGTYAGLLAGFGVIFGASVGVGYGISVSTANLAAKHKGLITGLIVAAFATTPVFLAPLLKVGVILSLSLSLPYAPCPSQASRPLLA